MFLAKLMFRTDFPSQDELPDQLLRAAHLLRLIEDKYLVKRAARGDGDHIAEFRDLAVPLEVTWEGDVARRVEAQPVGEERVRLLDAILPRRAPV